MPLSNKWNNESTIYKTTNKNRDMNRLIYRDNNGFEAFVVGETLDFWKIEGNGVKCSVWKNTTKNKIRKVSSDYILRPYKLNK
jgi:hypothetical protein